MLLDPKGEHFASCNACGKSYEVTRKGLKPARIRTAQGQGKTLKPFWVFAVDIKITQRSASGSVGSFLGKLLGSDKDTGAIRVFVPAYDLRAEDMMNLALAVTERQPKYEVTEMGDVLSVIMTEDDARKFIVPVVMGLEVRRKDTLHSISFDVKIKESSLDWVWIE